MIRLDKALASLGIWSRNDVKKLCRMKRITVNGEVITKSDTKIDEDAEIYVDDIPYRYTKYTYIMLHKPKGVISATEGNDPTVIDLIEYPPKGLFPCGRLDKDTTGLLLLTNDGQLAHQLLAPRSMVEKEYYVVLRDKTSDGDIEKLRKGIHDGDDVFLPAYYEKITDCSGKIILHEGKYHEIKRMFASLGNEVTELKRTRMKNLVLDENLFPGEYRDLTEEEITALREF